MGTLLGFDFGSHKIGVAVGETEPLHAMPLRALRNRASKPDWDAINALVEEWRPEAMVVGLPLEMSDNEAPIAAGARRFARQLEGRYQRPVHLIDEKLTSREAWDRLGSSAHRDPTRVDAVAAQLILETWLYERH